MLKANIGSVVVTDTCIEYAVSLIGYDTWLAQSFLLHVLDTQSNSAVIEAGSLPPCAKSMLSQKTLYGSLKSLSLKLGLDTHDC